MKQDIQNIVEELLKPRYKVIADYPLSKKYFNVGDIFYWNEKYESYRIDEKQVAMNKKTVEDYPHLFKPLAWWEERKESEMPQYVKSLINQKIYKVVNKNEVSFLGKSNIPGEMNIDYPWDNVLPATELAYNEQSKKL